jgi:hypothetical protein
MLGWCVTFQEIFHLSNFSGRVAPVPFLCGVWAYLTDRSVRIFEPAREDARDRQLSCGSSVWITC